MICCQSPSVCTLGHPDIELMIILTQVSSVICAQTKGCPEKQVDIKAEEDCPQQHTLYTWERQW